jgi:hypothetical protein
LLVSLAAGAESKGAGSHTETAVEKVLDEALLLLQEAGSLRFWHHGDMHAWDEDAFRQKLHVHMSELLGSPGDHTRELSKHAAEKIRQRMVALMQIVQTKFERWKVQVPAKSTRAGRHGPLQHSMRERDINIEVIHTILEALLQVSHVWCPRLLGCDSSFCKQQPEQFLVQEQAKQVVPCFYLKQLWHNLLHCLIWLT